MVNGAEKAAPVLPLSDALVRLPGRENGIVPEKPEKTNGIKVAVIGSGPSGLT